MKIRWYTFYTAGTKYETEALSLIEQFKKYDIEVTGVPYPNKTDWMVNCMSRSIQMNDIFNLDLENKEYPPNTAAPIGVLDTDLLVFKEPVLMREMPKDKDVLITDAGKVALGRRFSAGIVAFNSTVGGRAALAQWAKYCREDKIKALGLREQCYLEFAIKEHGSPQLSILPWTYNTIPSDPRIHDLKPVVVMHSRDPIYKGQCNAGGDVYIMSATERAEAESMRAAVAKMFPSVETTTEPIVKAAVTETVVTITTEPAVAPIEPVVTPEDMLAKEKARMKQNKAEHKKMIKNVKSGG